MRNTGEIVLYSEDKAIVVYHEGDNIKALKRAKESDIAPNEFLNQCPLCGHGLDDSQYTYVAHTYFYLLQRNFKKWSNERGAQAKSGDNRSASVGRRSNLRQPLVDSGPTLRSSDASNSKQRSISITLSTTVSQENYFHSHSNVEASSIEVPRHIPPELLVTGYYNRFFEEKMKLGSGSFGHVYYCIHIIDGLTLGEYAVKKLPVGDDRTWLRKMMREVKVRERLRHRNIVDYNHSWLEMHRLNEFCPYVPWLFVLMGYCNGGDLETFVKLHDEPLGDDEVIVLLLDILNGLCHLHRHGIIYRDLKPSNILLHLSQKEGIVAMLSDFGTCEIMAELSENSVVRQGFTGTVEYTAPELLETDQFGEFSVYYDTKSDMWSLGIILYYLCYGTIPYYDQCPKLCREKILAHTFIRLPREPHRCEELQMLIIALTQRNPERRPDCESILTNPRMLRLIHDEDFINTGKTKIALKISERSSVTAPGGLHPGLIVKNTRI